MGINIKVGNKDITRILQIGFLIMFTAFYIFMYRNDIRSYFVGMNYRYFDVNRDELRIPLIPTDWDSYPKLKDYSSSQYWINPNDSVSPRHHIKFIYVKNRFDSINVELDRYILEEKEYSNIELEIGYSFFKERRGKEPRFCYLREYPKIENRHWIDWNEEISTLDTLNFNEAIAILDSLGLDY